MKKKTNKTNKQTDECIIWRNRGTNAKIDSLRRRNPRPDAVPGRRRSFRRRGWRRGRVFWRRGRAQPPPPPPPPGPGPTGPGSRPPSPSSPSSVAAAAAAAAVASSASVGCRWPPPTWSTPADRWRRCTWAGAASPEPVAGSCASKKKKEEKKQFFWVNFRSRSTESSRNSSTGQFWFPRFQDDSIMSWPPKLSRKRSQHRRVAVKRK